MLSCKIVQFCLFLKKDSLDLVAKSIYTKNDVVTLPHVLARNDFVK